MPFPELCEHWHLLPFISHSACGVNIPIIRSWWAAQRFGALLCFLPESPDGGAHTRMGCSLFPRVTHVMVPRAGGESEAARTPLYLTCEWGRGCGRVVGSGAVQRQQQPWGFRLPWVHPTVRAAVVGTGSSSHATGVVLKVSCSPGEPWLHFMPGAGEGAAQRRGVCW